MKIKLGFIQKSMNAHIIDEHIVNECLYILCIYFIYFYIYYQQIKQVCKTKIMTNTTNPNT